MADEADDPCLSGRDSVLRSKLLHWARYTQPSPQWNHDHCEICWRRFAEPRAGYTDADEFGYTTADQYNWICKSCFEKYNERLGLVIELYRDEAGEIIFPPR